MWPDANAATESEREVDEAGLVTVASRHSVKATIDKLEAALKGAGVTVFARIDHAAGAASVGMELRPTQVLIFGNPKAGTPLMQVRQTIGLDLPLKVLAWEDAGGEVRVTHNDPVWLAARHGLADKAQDAVHALAAMLQKLVGAAVA